MKNLKMKLRERVLAAFLALVMIVTMLPANAIAASEQERHESAMNQSVTAEKQQYTVRTTVNKVGGEDSEEGGSVTLDGKKEENISVDSGSQVELYVKAANGYQISSVVIGTDEPEIKDPSEFNHIINVIDVDVEVVVTFVKVYTVKVTYDGNGTVSMDPESVGGSVTVDVGETVTLKATPNEGHRVAQVDIDGDVKTFTDNNCEYEKTFEDITKDHTIHITFKANQHTMEVKKTGNGILKVNGREEGEFPVDYGTEAIVSANPGKEYRVAKVIINGEVEEFTDNNSKYNKSFKVLGDSSVEVVFEPNNYKVNVTNDGNGKGDVWINGKSVIGSTSVQYGTSPKLEIKSDINSYLRTVMVNNKDVTKAYIDAVNAGKEYELSKVESNVNIAVTFSKINWIKPSRPSQPYETDDYIINFYEADGDVTTPSEFTDENGKKIYKLKEGTRFEITINNDQDKSPFDRVSVNDSEYDEVFVGTTTTDITQIAVSNNNAGCENRAKGLRATYYKTNFKIEFDENTLSAAVSVDDPQSNGYYTTDFIAGLDMKETERVKEIKCDVVEENEKGEEINRENIPSIHRIDNVGYWVDVIHSNFNSDNVYVEFTVTDVNDKEYTFKSVPLKILQAPEVSFSFNDSESPSSTKHNGYYQKARTATITVKDRIFNKDYVKNTMIVKDADGNDLTIETPEITFEQDKDDSNTYIGTMLIEDDGNYKWTPTYNNDVFEEVNIKSDSENPNEFTIDRTSSYDEKPGTETEPGNVKISIDEAHWWGKLLKKLTFGIWKSSDVEVTVDAKDSTSGIDSVTYYKAVVGDKINGLDPSNPLEEDDLDRLYNAKKFSTEPYTVSTDEAFVVYARVEDYAGNRCYVSTDGIIVDKVDEEDCRIELKPDDPDVTSDNGEHEYYNALNGEEYINIGVEASDMDSGIKSITYQVLCDNNVTQEGSLFEFTKENPTYDEIVKTVSKVILVDKKLNNSCDVEVIVTVTDNAGNVKKDSVSLDIDVTRPEISVEYDNNTVKKVDGERGYYDASRTATITFTEREHHFDKAKAEEVIKAGISAKGFDGKEINIDKEAMFVEDGYRWLENINNNNKDTHVIRVKFDTDANYTFDISYEDEAKNPSESVDWGTSKTPKEFTVDANGPEVTITDGTTVWSKVLEILTFGIWEPKAITVTASANDNVSPLNATEYYKVSTSDSENRLNPEKPLSEEDLKKIYKQNPDLFTDEPYTVDKDETFVVYARVEDYAGNTTYVSTDGIIVDKYDEEDCAITLTPELPEVPAEFSKEGRYGYYNLGKDDVKITVNAEDVGAGIKSVVYEIKRDGMQTKPETLFEFTETKPTYGELVKQWNGEISVDRKTNDSCNVEVIVTVTDNAGNKKFKSVFLDIDVTQPEINVTYNNNDVKKVDGARGYYDASRTATVTFTEREHHFNKEKAEEAIKARISAFDAEKKEIDLDKDAMLVGPWRENANGSNQDTYSIDVKFDIDANYTFDISYKDEAENISKPVNWGASKTPMEFTVDTNAPTGTVSATAEDWQVEGAEKVVRTWEELIKEEDFGFGRWSRKGIDISGTIGDVTSPTEAIQYYKTSNAEAMNETALDSVKTWKELDEGFTVKPNEQFTVYLKLTDYAGNVSYISTNGMIVDDVRTEETIAPEITVEPVQPVNELYNTDVDVDVNVIDPKAGDTYSGLKEVKYEVLNMGTVTQSGSLYTFDKENPKFDELQQEWNDKITVEKDKNNSNDVVIRIYAIDNAGNESSRDEKIKIDITEPSIDISYDNNSADSTKYYKNNRTATVVISERNFDAKDVKITAVGGHGNKPAISGWTKKAGTGNLDDTTYTATISYTADDDYTFAIAYKDLAGNVCPGEQYAAGTTNPKEFTIDKTIPTMDVTYDNNSVLNENYYKEERTATIRVVEHNFDPSRVNVQINATDNGSATTAPSVSGWTTNGDVHTATIHYANDAMYTFNLAFTDNAGNQAAPFTTQTFYVDKTKPSVSITNIVDQSANTGKEKIGFVLTATDTNFDVFTPVLKAVVMENGEFVTKTMDAGVISDTANGKVYTVDNLDTDGIYHLTCTVVDKAGNAFEEVTLYDADGKAYQEKRTAEDDLVVFSVNRDGSTYELDSFTSNINGGYVYEVYEDVVFVEINADPLLKYAVTVNGKELKEDKDYTVTESTGEGLWHKYTYVIDKGYFAEEGEYAVVVSSVDKADSDAYSDVKGASVKFTVDKTAPVVTVSGLANDGRYQVKEQTVTVIPTDDGGKLNSMVCEILDRDGNVVEKAIDLSGEEFEKALNEGDGKLTFTISEGMYQQVRIVCKDSALNDKGDTNTYETIYKNVTVSPNVFKIFWANVALRYGVLIALALAVGGFIFFIIMKKKKEEEN